MPLFQIEQPTASSIGNINWLQRITLKSCLDFVAVSRQGTRIEEGKVHFFCTRTKHWIVLQIDIHC